MVYSVESNLTKGKILRRYLRGVFWRMVLVIDLIIIVAVGLTFADIWYLHNWLVDTIYQPNNGADYAICGACFLWPLAVRLREVSLSQIETINNLIKRNPRRVFAGRLVGIRLSRLFHPVKGLRG